MRRIWLVLLSLLLFSQPLVAIFLPSSETSLPDLTPDAILITSKEQYAQLGFYHVEKPYVYRKFVLSDAHLPFAVKFKFKPLLLKKFFHHFIKEVRGENRIQKIEYLILVNETYNVTVPIYETRQVEKEVYNNETGQNETILVNETYISGYKNETRYHWVWKELNKTDLKSLERNRWYIFDIHATLKPSLRNFSVDIVPSFTVKVKIFGKEIIKHFNLTQFAWWNSNWQYRKKLTISNAVNEYQMKIKVYKDDGHDNPVSGEIDTEGHCKDDFGDIRFANETSELPYWIEEKVDGNYAIIWVKLPSDIESQSEKHIYMYYGNPSATTTSDGDDTFLFFDDFEGTNLDANKWDWDWADVTVSNSVFETTDGENQIGMMSKNTISESNIAVGEKFYYDGDDNDPILNLAFHRPSNDLSKKMDEIDGYLAEWSYDTTSRSFNYWIRLIYSGSDEGSTSSKPQDLPRGQWHIFEMRKYGTTIRLYRDEVEKLSSTTTHELTSGYISIGAWTYVTGQTHKWDWIYVRKYADPEPTWSNFGSEEKCQVPPTISNPQPANNSANVPITLSQLSVEISDPNGDLMNWTIETSPDIGSASGTNTPDGTITCPVSNLTYGTIYHWFVNVTDGYVWTNKTYTFTTETPDPPSNLKATSINTTTISLTWTKSPDTDTTVVVRKEGSYPTSVTDGVIVYNGTAESFTDTGLNAGTAYYYRAWSWAANAFSQSYTSTVNYTYPACPSNLQVIDFTDASITLSWNKGDGADRTLIYRNAQFIANTTDTTYTDDGLDPVTEYSYELYAYDSESGYRSLTSVQIYQYTRPEKPKNFGVSPVNETAIRLIWAKGEGADKTIVVRKSGDFPSSIDDGIVIYNGTGTIYNDVGLAPGTIYYYRAWSWSASLSYLSSDYAQDYASTYPQPPSDVSTSLSPSGTTATLTISWSKGVGAQKTVIVKNQNHFPINKDDGIIVYNGTGTSYSETISQTYYYTLFSYANGLFSSGIKAKWSAIWLNCYDEKTGQAIRNWSIFISDYLGTQVYSAENLTNSHIINVSQCPTGEKISFLFSAPNHSERVYYISVNSSTITTINAYLPQSNESQLYLIHIVGPQSEFSSPNIDNANIVIKKYIDTTESYETVTSVYTDANGQADVYLIPNTLYKVIISKQGYRTEIVDFIPSSEIYTKTFRILPEAEELTEYVQFWNVITFNATMLSNNTIRIVYVDSNQSTIDVDLYTYELYNSQYTLIDSFTTTDNIFTHYVEGINTSRTYLVKLYFNNTANFDISPPVTITVFPLTGIPEAPNKYDINNLIEPVIGPAPGGSWAPILAIILPLIILASFGPYNTTIGIVGSGLSLLFIQAIYARWFINSFNPLLAALGPFVIAIGILYGMTKGRGEEKL